MFDFEQVDLAIMSLSIKAPNMLWMQEWILGFEDYEPPSITKSENEANGLMHDRRQNVRQHIPSYHYYKSDIQRWF